MPIQNPNPNSRWYINTAKLRYRPLQPNEAVVTIDNARINMTVWRGKHWRSSWRDDIDRNDPLFVSDINMTKRRLSGKLIGFTDAYGKLVGQCGNRKFNILATDTPQMAVVEWDNGIQSVYAIGHLEVFALCTGKGHQ